MRNKRLQFLIEFKFSWNREGLGTKDQTVLREAVTKRKWAKKAYLIEAVVNPTSKRDRHGVPYRNKIITIRMDKDKLDDFQKAYKKGRKPKPRAK